MTLRLAILVVLLTCRPVMAADWGTKDTVMLGGALGLLAVDWAQTRDLAQQRQTYYATPACADPQTRNQPLAGACPVQTMPNYHELNPLLPANPSVGQVDRYFAVAMIGAAGLSYALPAKYRHYFLGGVIVLESVVVLHNHSIGLRVRF